MNGIEKITDRIAAETAGEAKALLDRAQQEAASIRQGYEAVADQEYKDTLAQGKKDAAERVERLGGVAQLEARKLNLAARQEMLDKAFDLAMEKLLTLPEDEYAKLLTSLALRASSTGTEALVFSTTDRARYGKRVVLQANEQLESQGKTAALTLSEESRPFRGGLYVQNGKIETNCTFSTLLRLQRQQMAGEVAKVLFD
jgi:V/A-type H+-transporting ATPase subunit E